jgi:hypothetical protein
MLSTYMLGAVATGLATIAVETHCYEFAAVMGFTSLYFLVRAIKEYH